jgi:hypothetical protein
MDTLRQVFTTTIQLKAAKYFKRQLITARKAYDFIIRMGYISYKAAAEVFSAVALHNLALLEPI